MLPYVVTHRRETNIPPEDDRRQSYEYRPHRHTHALLDATRRRPRAVRRLSAPLPAARRPARAVLRARPRGAMASSCTPMDGPAASASTRSRRSRSTTSCPGTSVLSFGTAGCNLACKFCQNWDMSKSREMDTLADAAAPEELAATPQPARLRERGVHVQRPDRLHRVRDRRRRQPAMTPVCAPSRSPRATSVRSRAPSSSRRWTRPTST